MEENMSFYMNLFAMANEKIERKMAGENIVIDFEELKKIVKSYIELCKNKQIKCNEIDTEINFETDVKSFMLKEISNFVKRN